MAIATIAALALAACSSGTSTAPSAGTRAVETSTGTVQVPEHPTRIVAGTAWSLDTLLDLGVTPVGMFSGGEDIVLPKYRAQLKDVVSISADNGFSADREKITVLEPDLIFDFASSETLADERKIAATIGQDPANASWEDLTAQVAQAIGKTAQLDELKARYEQKLDALKTKYAEVWTSTTWYVVQPGLDAGAPAVLFAPKNTEAGVILGKLGATFGAAEAGTNYGDDNTDGKSISSELLPTLSDGEAIIVWDNGEEPSGEATTLFEQPLWKNLPAVQADTVLRASMPGSYGQALAFLDKLESLAQKLQK
ncbi:ABC transporter substrate-binding protein [Plantibacter sp. YIM 135347]|uniref:ABC transporter substrate-binding protein n=1 Tax=Plantibacter sp. YIM 135347 TaxID=3423919 RepID=UPI003D349885